MLALIIFLVTYLALAIGRLPGLRVDRTGVAIIGATLMIASKSISIGQAYAAIDYNTIILLFGMMIVIANLRLSGFFTLVSAWVVEHAHRPVVLLTAIVCVSGFFSAFFVNDTMCLVLTPLVLEIARRLRRNPVPYLLAVAMAANIGSVATITGNPQNMMIGSFSGIGYRAFSAGLAPVAAVSLLVVPAVLIAVYRSEFLEEQPMALDRKAVRVDRPLLWKSLLVSGAMIVFFFAGSPVSEVALIAGTLLLITRRVGPEKVYREIDWPLLVMFVGLFIVVAAVDRTPLSAGLVAGATRFHLERTSMLTACSAALSNIVSNVPAVLVFKPVVARLADSHRAWLVLAMSSTLAGNLTILGSVANLIVIERARPEVRISFWEYAKTGIPVTVITLAIGVALL
ncbi:MAG TPA: anion transporter [Bryobacteraceae bacterium]|nr:anion transporter [Bryobacteraceae bacterium]